jgi:hypothetical protein
VVILASAAHAIAGASPRTLDGEIRVADFATIAGVIGTITGVVALILSIKSYARVSAMKALDLRLELGKAFANLDIVLSGIDGYLDYVHQSHLRVLAATGRNRSGEMEEFEADFANDKARLRGLLGSQPKRDTDYTRYSPDELERDLATVHAFHALVAALRAKYQALFDSDEGRRREIREAHR